MEFDVALETFLSTGKSINDNVGKLAKGHARPIRSAVGASNIPSAATTQTIALPLKPASGRMWYIHRVVVLGADGHTAVPGAVCDVYAGPSGELLPDATSQLYSGLLVPSIVEEGRYHNPVVFGETVYAIFYSLPANQVLQFAVGYYDYPAPDQLAMSA